MSKYFSIWLVRDALNTRNGPDDFWTCTKFSLEQTFRSTGSIDQDEKGHLLYFTVTQTPAQFFHPNRAKQLNVELLSSSHSTTLLPHQTVHLHPAHLHSCPFNPYRYQPLHPQLHINHQSFIHPLKKYPPSTKYETIDAYKILTPTKSSHLFEDSRARELRGIID